MSAVPVAERMTAEEFLALPAPARSQRRQLVDGEVVVNEPRPLHQRVLMDLAFALESWTREDPSRGEVTLPLDVRLDDLAGPSRTRKALTSLWSSIALGR